MRSALPATVLIAILCILSGVPALAQPFPSKPVRIIVPYAAGTADILARALGNRLSNLWGQPVLIENVGGAAGNIGTGRVASAIPDGYTLLFTIDQTVVTNRFVFKTLPYDPDSLIPITMLTYSGMFVIVNSSVPANSLHELVEVARRAPGTISYGDSGMGGPPNLFFETIAKREGVRFLHVAYRGIAAAISAVVSGEVQASGSSAGSAGGLLKAGRIKALAIGGARRSNLFPDIPTLAEAGYPYAEMSIWYGLFAPGGTNTQLVQKIYQDVTNIAKQPEFTEKYVKSIDHNLVANTPAEFAAAIRAQLAATGEMVKAAGITPE